MGPSNSASGSRRSSLRWSESRALLLLLFLPLRGTVIFPGLTAPIAAGRPGTLRAIEAALKGDRLVFAVAQRDYADAPLFRQDYDSWLKGVMLERFADPGCAEWARWC